MTKTIRSMVTLTLLTLVMHVPTAAAFGIRDNLVFVVNGTTVANVQPAPDTHEFSTWCTSTCRPSTQMPLYDAKTGQLKGHVYTWTKPFQFGADNQSYCFSEFAEFALPDGSIYAHSGPRGTCGAFIDPALKTGTHAGPGAKVTAAGGDGGVVGGTFRYRGWVGTYTDRLFAELNASGGGYYDELFWSISAHGV